MASVIGLMLRALACTLMALNCCELIMQAKAERTKIYEVARRSDKCEGPYEERFRYKMTVEDAEEKLLGLARKELIAGDSVGFLLGLRDLSCTIEDLKRGKDLRWRYYKCSAYSGDKLLAGLQEYFDHYMRKRRESCGRTFAAILEEALATFDEHEIRTLEDVNPRTEASGTNRGPCKKLYDAMSNLVPCEQFERLRHYNTFIQKWYIKIDHCLHIVQESRPTASWC